MVAQVLPKHWAVGSNPITRSCANFGSRANLRFAGDFRSFLLRRLYRRSEAGQPLRARIAPDAPAKVRNRVTIAAGIKRGDTYGNTQPPRGDLVGRAQRHIALAIQPRP